MATRLYLDTARLGLMSLNVRRISREFAELQGSEGCSVSFEQFFWNGTDSWSNRQRKCFPALSMWDNPNGLKTRLRRIIGQNQNLPVYIASRSSELFQIAMRVLGQRCRRVLTTDAEWPDYMKQLRREEFLPQLKIVQSTATTELPDDDSENIVENIRKTWKEMSCDGLVLSAVNHLGRLLPIRQIVESLTPSPKFVVIDGAQHLGHLPTDSLTECCDLYIAGCHKWLASGVPMGVALCCRDSSAGFIESEVQRSVMDGSTSDPLLRLLELQRTDNAVCCGETVNVAPLLNCRAAIAEASDFVLNGPEQLSKRLANGNVILDRLGKSTLKTATPLETGILTLRSTREDIKLASPETIRTVFQKRGIAVSAFDGGYVRLSMPVRKLSDAELHIIVRCLRQLT